jgi:parallel beta-helix repeat protein
MQCKPWEPRAAVRVLATILGVLGLTLGSVLPTHADAINCGDVLGPGGHFQLEQDLTCTFLAGGNGITVRDGAILDLNGYRVTCSPSTVGCVVLTGEGAQLRNGTVDGGGFHESIVLEGMGGHIVRDVTSTLTDANIIVNSDHNQLINVRAESRNFQAVVIFGDDNRLTNSITLCPSIFAGCIAVFGDENRLSDNIVSVEEDCCSPNLESGGIRIDGKNNQLRRNRVTNSGGPGIVVTGTGNDIRFNTAQGTAFDLVDTNGD